MKLLSPLLTLFVVLFLASCAKSIDGGSGDERQVRINAQISAKTSINFTSAEGANVDLTQLPTPTAADFKMAITSGADTVASYLNGSGEAVKLNVGSYKISATYGSDMAASFNSVYYHGADDFTLSNSQSNVDVSLKCPLNTAFAFINFDDNFHAMFSDISALISTEHTEQPLIFVDGEKRIASLRPAKRLLVRVEATLKSSGKKHNYGINPVDSLLAGDLHVFNFTVESGEVSVGITVDNGVKVTERSAKLDENWLANRYTRITSTANTASMISTVYGLPFTTPTDMVVSSNIGLKNMMLRFDAANAAELGVDSIDLLSMSESERAIVANTGVVITELGTGGMNYRVNFKGCVNRLKVKSGAETAYGFGISVTDMVDSYCKNEVNFNVIPPRFERLELNNNKIYNRFGYIPAAQVTNVSDADKKRFSMIYWISGDDGENWTSLGMIEGVGDIYVDKLEPNKEYVTKITFEGAEYGERRAFKTTSEWAIPNGNFDEPAPSGWPSYGGSRVAMGADFGGWATLNLYTSLNKTDNNYFKSMPCVEQVNGRSGKGAEMTIVGWGANAVYKCRRYTEWFQTKYEWTRTKDKTTAGKIFLGTYNYDASSEDAGQSHGIAVENFGKPSVLSFWYKHNALKEVEAIAHVEILAGDNSIIGSGTYKSNAAKAEFTNVKIPITYTQSSLTKQAASIKLYFSPKSTPAVVDDVDQYDGTAPSKNSTIDVWDARWYGAKMVVDDIELIYPTELSQITVQ